MCQKEINWLPREAELPVIGLCGKTDLTIVFIGVFFCMYILYSKNDLKVYLGLSLKSEEKIFPGRHCLH